MKARIVLTALVIALFATLLAGSSASAGQQAPGKVPINPIAKQLTLLGKTMPRAPAHAQAPSRDSVTKSKFANIANRQVPRGKSAKAPNAGAALFPVVTPDNIAGRPLVSSRAANGLNAWDNLQANLFDLEPPDQMLCAGNGYVLEGVNVTMAVFDKNFNKLTGDIALNNFFLRSPDEFTSDPRCYYDPGVKRWFVTMLSLPVLTATPAPPAPGDALVLLAVSQTDNPLGSWVVYALETGLDNCPDLAAQPCFGDKPLLGANQDAIEISTNNFSVFNAPFYGDNYYLVDKQALVANGNMVQVAYFPLGTLNTPDGPCDQVNFTCWYTVEPAFSPDAAQWDYHAGGVAYAMSALDFFGNGDNRIAVWVFFNTSSIHGAPGSWNIGVAQATLGSEVYINPKDFSPQKDDGLLPLGTWYNGTTPPAGPITANFSDEMQQVVYSAHTLWGSLGTALLQKFGQAGTEYHNGVAWFAVKTFWKDPTTLTVGVAKQGYVAPKHADALFPSIAVTGQNKGDIAFTLTSKDYYPSAGYAPVSLAKGSGRVYIGKLGEGSQDGFTEYDMSYNRPRWGDYSAAVAYDGQIYMAAEMIQHPNCPFDYWYSVDFTCGNTRSFYINWGTAMYRVVP